MSVVMIFFATTYFALKTEPEKVKDVPRFQMMSIPFPDMNACETARQALLRQDGKGVMIGEMANTYYGVYLKTQAKCVDQETGEVK